MTNITAISADAIRINSTALVEHLEPLCNLVEEYVEKWRGDESEGLLRMVERFTECDSAAALLAHADDVREDFARLLDFADDVLVGQTC